MPTATGSVLDRDSAAFLLAPVSMMVASRGPYNIPNLGRGLGCRVTGDHQRVSILVARPECRELLSDLSANGSIAVVFSRPATHRSLQLKGTDGEILPPSDGDWELAASYRDAFVAELCNLGYPEPSIRAMLACAREDLIAVTFTPSSIFNQTPGPRAGTPLQATQ